MGSGKTYLGKQLGEKLRLPFFDLDAQIESNEGKTINQLFDENGEEHFRLLEKDSLHIITESHESFIMATGGGTPCYYNNIDYMNFAGTTVWLNSTIDTLFERLLKEKSKRPLLKNLDESQIKAFIQKKFSDIKIYYEQASISVEDDKESLEKILKKIFHE
jgi:shikimate kinase